MQTSPEQTQASKITLLDKHASKPRAHIISIKMVTVVIVPGSFCPVECYKNQIDSLTRHGISSVAVSLPSVGRRDAGPATMSDDADEIVSVVEPLLADGKSVVLLTHSYGGVPGTQSLERLSQKARAAQGKAGGVETIIYLASVILPVGMSNWEVSGGNIPDFLTVEVRQTGLLSLNLISVFRLLLLLRGTK